MLREKLKRILIEASGAAEGILFSLEVPPRPEYGDYATNLPLSVAKASGKNPMDVANEIAAKISDPAIKKVVAAPPGFINITLSQEILASKLERILSNPHTYGEGNTKAGKRIQVEFISANPTGPLTLANGRGGFLGDVLSKVLIMQGAHVEREYYVNDAGNQIRTLGASILRAAGMESGSVDEDTEYYRGDYIEDWAQKNLEKIKNIHLPEEIGRIAAKDFLKALIQQPIEEKMKIHFDRWTSEYADLHETGLVQKAIQIFKDQNLVDSKEGAEWLKTTEFGDDKDRVLITADGFPTYLAADAGHYLETVERGFQKKILILGADHHGYVRRLQAVAKIIGLPESEIIIMQLVKLTRGGEEVRMSKRRGVYVTIEELLDEVGVDAARYFFLEKNPETHINFDMDLAKKKSKENPVYYIQYAYARLASIFRKSSLEPKSVSINVLHSDSERALLMELLRFPDVIEDSAMDYRVSRIVHYAYELAHAFHLFYEKNRILDAEEHVKNARLALALAAQHVLKRTLSILGMSAPDEM